MLVRGTLRFCEIMSENEIYTVRTEIQVVNAYAGRKSLGLESEVEEVIPTFKVGDHVLVTDKDSLDFGGVGVVAEKGSTRSLLQCVDGEWKTKKKNQHTLSYLMKLNSDLKPVVESKNFAGQKYFEAL